MAATVRAVASASAAGATITCNAPPGTVSGDLLLAFHSADAGTLAAMTTPTGGATWLPLGQQLWAASTEPGTKVWWKFAGSEPGSFGFPQNASADGVVGIAAIIGAASTTPVFASSASATTGTTVPTPSITPTGADDLELRWAASKLSGGAALTWTSPATYTEQIDRQSSTFTAASLATKELASGSATGILNFTASVSSTSHMGFTVAVAAGVFTPPRPVILGQAVQRAAFY